MVRDAARLVRRNEDEEPHLSLGEVYILSLRIGSHCSTWHKAVTKAFLGVEDGLGVSLAL